MRDKTFLMRDKIFLLSAEEYERHRDKVPPVYCYWWLRSPGNEAWRAKYVNDCFNVIRRGIDAANYSMAVRPALRIESSESSGFKIGDRFVEADFPWVVIGDGLAIAEVPIALRRFDDTSYNNYEESEIRQFLLGWYAERTKENEDNR